MSKPAWLRLAPGPNLAFLVCNLLTAKIRLLLLPVWWASRLVFALKPLGVFWLISLLLLGAFELNKATLAKITSGVVNESVQRAFDARTNSVAKYEGQGWIEVYEDAVYYGPRWARYLWSGRPSALTPKPGTDQQRGWFYLDPGEKAASNFSNWNFDAAHMGADLAVWSIDANPAIGDVALPFAWHRDRNDSDALNAEPVDSPLLRFRRTYEHFSDYAAGLQAQVPQRSEHVQRLLSNGQLFVSAQDQARAEERSRQNLADSPRARPLLSPRKFMKAAGGKKAIATLLALDPPVRVRDHLPIRFWEVTQAQISGIEEHPVIDLPPVPMTLAAGAEIRRLLDRVGEPIVARTASMNEGWFVRSANNRTGFVTGYDYEYFTEKIEVPYPTKPGDESLESAVIANEPVDFYLLTADQKALVMQHRDVTDRDKPLTLLPEGTAMRRVLNEYRHPSAGGIGDGTFGWLVKVEALNLFGLVRETEYQQRTRPESAQP